MNPMVEFCISNLANGSQEAFDILEQDPDLDVLEYGCLSYCSLCSETLFAIVNGDVVEGNSSEELVSNIYKYIEENPLF
ncbi:MAG: YuzB family protein [Psychrobacillus sp.]|uniref:YuzB family protein n=1 Tax=unclassified Psychrobacillus TaxID=2636677 RepID=UPI00203F016E|nr:YuzB family protein [Psychrobacillus sp. MER TA 171]MCM3359608.1 YuzB family protein [Psychrobacillus sp. MER TA 171]